MAFLAKVFLAVSVLAAYLLWGKGAVSWIARLNALINLWVFGVSHNFIGDPDNLPGAVVTIHMLSSLVGLGLLIYAVA